MIHGIEYDAAHNTVDLQFSMFFSVKSKKWIHNLGINDLYAKHENNYLSLFLDVFNYLKRMCINPFTLFSMCSFMLLFPSERISVD